MVVTQHTHTLQSRERELPKPGEFSAKDGLLSNKGWQLYPNDSLLVGWFSTKYTLYTLSNSVRYRQLNMSRRRKNRRSKDRRGSFYDGTAASPSGGKAEDVQSPRVSRTYLRRGFVRHRSDQDQLRKWLLAFSTLISEFHERLCGSY